MKWFFVFAALWAFVGPATAFAETRKLSLYYTHTKESATVTFKKNGKYVKSGLRKLNRLLRDFRRNEPTKMDPKLFDLVWEVYKRSGSKKPIHVISGYRSPRTNNMLRRRGRKVAKNSMHTKGRALDFFMPDVPVAKLRALGLRAHGGGVGYYRGSFVHLDTGRVRHWPRMSRRQLSKVFPRGRTIHVPSDGKPMKRHKVARANIRKGLYYDGSRKVGGSRKTLLARVFSDDKEDTKTPARKRSRTQQVAAKREAPKRRKPSGPDPFAQEVAAAKKAERKEREETVALAAAAQKALEQAPVEEAEELALPTRVAIPRARPEPNVQVARAEETTPATETSGGPQTTVTALRREDSTDPAERAFASVDPGTGPLDTGRGTLAPITRADLAARSNDNRLAVPRPSVGIGGETAQQPVVQRELAQDPAAAPVQERDIARSEPVAEQPKQDVAALAQRSQSALAALRRLSESERAARERENAELANKLAKLPIPKLPERSRPQLASLSQDEASEPGNATSHSAVPVQRPSNTNESQIATVKRSQMEGELQLGNLDGRDVKMWALAESTRVGPIAQLSAPRYDQGTRRAAPASVLSAGFGTNPPPLRADRFTGRALTRVAFANFNISRN